jgi:NADPH-dependent ferric siderophore reductase
MGRTLAVIADRVDAQSIPAVVVAREALGANLTRLVLASPEFSTATTDPCDVTAFRVSRKDFRHYTPAALDRAARELTIIVHRHGGGLGEQLIAGWSVGDGVKVCQWSSTRTFRWHESTEPVVLLGDATVISLAMAFTDRAGHDPGVALDGWLAEHPEAVVALGHPAIYLAGHGQSIQRQRAFLRETCGIDRRRISTQPYWATGRSGL